MIDIRKLKELVRLMVANELTELDLRDNEEQVTLRRGPGDLGPARPVEVSAPPAAVHHPTEGAPPAADADDGLIRIEAPMVGTFFAASDPDSTPFVTVGSTIAPDTAVCIVEAMKIFNEIKADCSGTIQKVLVKNGESVEFGQALFLVKPA